MCGVFVALCVIGRGADPPQPTNRTSQHRNESHPIHKTQYLGGERERKRVVKASEKMRLKFDWEAAEDTSR